MNVMQRSVITAAALVGLTAAPAAAQEPSWVQQIERQAEALARRIEAQFGQRIPREPRNVPESSEPFSHTARLGRNGTLDLQNVAGDISVTGGGGNDVRINATRRVRHASDAQRRALLKELQVRVVERGGDVEVRTQYPSRRGAFAAVDYAVAVPNGANLTLKTMSGDVRVTNVGGEVRVESVSGNVTASVVRRLRAVKTISGNLDVSDGETEELSANTVSGTVTVRGLKGRTLDLQSVSGDVRLVDVEMQRVSVRSMAGDLEYQGRLADSGRYELQSHSGNIRIAPTGNQGFDLDATTFGGDVRSDYELKLIGGGDAALRRGPGRAVRGTFGDARAVLTARSFSGNVIIVKR